MDKNNHLMTSWRTSYSQLCINTELNEILIALQLLLLLPCPSSCLPRLRQLKLQSHITKTGKDIHIPSLHTGGEEALTAFSYHSWNFLSSLHWLYILHVAKVPTQIFPTEVNLFQWAVSGIQFQSHKLCAFPHYSCKSFSVLQMPFHLHQEASLPHL